MICANRRFLAGVSSFQARLDLEADYDDYADLASSPDYLG
jgi:hypothetical protein